MLPSLNWSWLQYRKLYFYSVFYILHLSLPFPAEDDEDGGEDGPRSDPGHPGVGKGLSREQKEGLDMVKHIMLSLDEDDGLDQIYTFRLVSKLQNRFPMYYTPFSVF